MRSASPELLTDIASGSATLTRLWKIARTDGVSHRLTHHDRDVIINDGSGSAQYRASAAFVPQAILSTAGSGVSTTEMKVVFTEDDLTGFKRLDLIRGVYDNATVHIYLCDWKHPEHGVMLLMAGDIGRTVVSNKGMGSFEVRGILARADRTLGELYTAECRADLGDKRCKKNLDDFTWTGNLVIAAPDQSHITFNHAGLDLPAGMLSFGVITWETGATNEGLAMEILRHDRIGDVHTLLLALPMPRDIVSFDPFTAYAGCDKRRITCKVKFDNILNYRGEPWVPGMDGANARPVE